MPITILSISRRRFLSMSLAGAAALSLRRSSLGASEQRDPDRMVLLSDIHIPTDPKKSERGVNMTQHMRQAVAEVLALEKEQRPPAAMIINGDLAHHTGETADYRALLGVLAPLSEAGLPVHLAMGNHDQRPRFWAAVPYEKIGGGDRRLMDNRQVLVIKTPRLNWVVLDTLDKTNATPGQLGREQLAWLNGVLDASDKPAVVMFHHDPVVPKPAKPATHPASTKPAAITGLVDTRALLDVIMPRKQVKAVIFGHTHVWSIQQLDGLHLVNLPAVAYVFDAKQPSAWVDCQVADGGMRLHLHCLNPKHPWHGQVKELRWREGAA